MENGSLRRYRSCRISSIICQASSFLAKSYNDIIIPAVHNFWHIREHIVPSSEKKQAKIKDKETTKKEDQVALWVVRAREAAGYNILLVGKNKKMCMVLMEFNSPVLMLIETMYL
jgi:hypothetical protein